MPICNLYELINAISPGQKVLGLDVGKKTIGLSLADPQTRVASPKPVLWRKKFTTDAKLLVEQIHEFNIGGLVLGWPLNMDGTAGPRCDSIRVRRFTGSLETFSLVTLRQSTILSEHIRSAGGSHSCRDFDAHVVEDVLATKFIKSKLSKPRPTEFAC